MTEEARFLDAVVSLPFLAFALVVTGLHLGYLVYALVADTVAWFRRLHRLTMRWRYEAMAYRYAKMCRYLNEQQVPKARLIKKRRGSHEHPHRHGDPQGTGVSRRRRSSRDLHA